MSCLDGYGFLNNNSMCASPCPLNTNIYLLDDRYCVSKTCPADTTVDGTDQSICWKAAIPKSGSCNAGYTEWTPGFCYLNCPNGFRENGRNCVLSLLPRGLQTPYCGRFSYFDQASKQCLMANWFIVVTSLFIVLIFGGIYKTFFRY